MAMEIKYKYFALAFSILIFALYIMAVPSAMAGTFDGQKL